MSSTCLSGGGRAYEFDREIIKSPSTSARTSQTSSPSSTLSEASNSQLAICTRKCRTPRKRPNQTYNEAAALLSTHLAEPQRKSSKQRDQRRTAARSPPNLVGSSIYASCSCGATVESIWSKSDSPPEFSSSPFDSSPDDKFRTDIYGR